MAKFPLTLDQFKDIYSQVPRLTVELCFIEDSKILLTKRSIKPCIGMWHIPGGTVYFGETVNEAIHRIAKEECGVEVEILQFIGCIEYPKMHKAGYFGWPVGLAHRVSINSGDVSINDQASEFGYFSKAPSNTIEDQVKFIEQIVSVN